MVFAFLEICKSAGVCSFADIRIGSRVHLDHVHAEMNALQYSQINAFISPRDDGNPAAVILLDRDYDDNILQQVARRLGLAETAFLQLLESTSEPVYRLRWFTPSV